MTVGVGLDLVQISRMERVLATWDERFVQRIFTAREARICRGRPHPAAAFALRFAAKEAFAKAIGLGMKKGIRWRDIEVFNRPSGQPGLRLYGRSLEVTRALPLANIHVSLSDEGDYAMAIVVLA